MSMKFLTWLTTYVLVVLCELGDKTQMAVLMLSSNNPGKKWLILGASALALSCCVLIEVTVGTTLARYIGPQIINKATGWVFLLVGLFTLGSHFNIWQRIFPRQQKAKNPDVSPNFMDR